ncbi:Bll5565 protein [hydrothermal vent metagenome]|uniref:Bll5565 protein n=1 Tax=hydrothermal vent metagenome TaxID=652676 RepID=A0A1W1ECT5_9ZZZZ
MLTTIKHKLISLLQLILVLIYIVFEELIWESIARPIYEFIHGLKILNKIETLLLKVNSYVILLVFVLLLLMVETLGVYAGVLFVSGNMWHGITLYLMKVPIAAFTFWIFRITEKKLMKFGWFKWMYNLLMRGIEWIKSSDIYIYTVKRMEVLKASIKEKFKGLKIKYFANRNSFILKIKSLYLSIKKSIKKKL